MAKTETSLKAEFYEFEELIEKIKKNGDVENLNISKIEEALEEFRAKIEYIIKEKNIREASVLELEIYHLKNEIINVVTDGAHDAHILGVIDDGFNSLEWKDVTKARHLINQGKQKVVNGDTANLKPILGQIINLMVSPEEIGPEGKLKKRI